MSTQQASNSITKQSLEAMVDQLGIEAGKGADTQIKFHIGLVEAAYHQVIDTTADKHGAGIDDAQYYVERYHKAKSGATVFDAKGNAGRKAAATSRTCIKLGMWSKGGIGEPISTVNNLITDWQKERRNPANKGKLDDATNTLLKYARAQLKRDQLVDPQELRSFIFKKPSTLPTAEDILDGTRKQLQKLYDGKAANNTQIDNSVEVKAAIQSLTKRLRAIADEKRAAQTAVPAPVGKQAAA